MHNAFRYLALRSSLTALGTLLFFFALVLLFVTLYLGPRAGKMWIAALGLYGAAAISWWAAAYWGQEKEGNGSREPQPNVKARDDWKAPPKSE